MPASETETQEGNEQSLQDEVEEIVRLRSTFPQRRPTSAICTRRTPAGSAPSDANGVDILRRQWGPLSRGSSVVQDGLAWRGGGGGERTVLLIFSS